MTEVISVKDALNEYFRLKNKFENEVARNKKKIINNPTLSKREKRSEYLKLKPKCVNCKRPSMKGTLFSVEYIPSTDKSDGYRVFRSSCGDLADPCNLKIEINLGNSEPLEKLMDNIRDEIKKHKDEIIDDKNKLLFGLTTTEEVLENFDMNKTYINDLTSLYEKYLDEWNQTVESEQKRLELEEATVQMYNYINEIKTSIKKMNENDDVQYAIDAAQIYHTTLEPLLQKIRHLKYSENMIYHDDETNTCRLIQQKYTEYDTAVSSYSSKVAKYDVGLQAKKAVKGPEKKSMFIIESDLSPSPISSSSPLSSSSPSVSPVPSAVQKEGQPLNEVPMDEPIIGQGKDGIEWNIPEYKDLWSKLPEKLRNEFKLNIDWMKEFMHKCVNEHKKAGPSFNGCHLTTPPNLVIPPRKNDATGQYDFGVSIYNTTFNKQPKTLQDTYLTFYKEDPVTKTKNYSMMENAVNALVEKEVDFGKGYF